MSAADFAFLIAESDPFYDWWLAVAFVVVGGGIGFLIVWALTRHTRNMAHAQAGELVEVARREAAVTAEEIKQKAEAEIQEKRAELNREFDRREIESDVRLREIRAHEESLALLDYQLEQRQERLNRESAAVKQARDAIRALSKSVRKRLEGVSHLDADEIRKQLREEVLLECQDEFRVLRRATLEKSEQEL
ncbi:MAG: Rnase Y domain-containing protein, partial [Opitutaceae bacterium]